MDVAIRKAKEEELRMIQELNHQLFLYDKEYDPSLNTSWSFEQFGEDYFRDRISGKGGVCFAAEVNGELILYLSGGMMRPYSYRTIKKMSELENTLVKEDFRGQGKHPPYTNPISKVI